MPPGLANLEAKAGRRGGIRRDVPAQSLMGIVVPIQSPLHCFKVKYARIAARQFREEKLKT